MGFGRDQPHCQCLRPRAGPPLGQREAETSGQKCVSVAQSGAVWRSHGTGVRGSHLALSGFSVTGTTGILPVLSQRAGLPRFPTPPYCPRPSTGAGGSSLQSAAPQSPAVTSEGLPDSELVAELQWAARPWQLSRVRSPGYFTPSCHLVNDSPADRRVFSFPASVVETLPVLTFPALSFFIYKMDSFQIVGDLLFVRLLFFFFKEEPFWS